MTPPLSIHQRERRVDILCVTTNSTTFYFWIHSVNFVVMNHPRRGVFPKPMASCWDCFALTCDRLGCISCRRGSTDLRFWIECFACLFCMFYICQSWECMLLAEWSSLHSGNGWEIFAGGRYKLWLISVSIPIQSALWVTNFVCLARSRLLFVLLDWTGCFRYRLQFRDFICRLCGDSENDPFRRCVVSVTGICSILIVVRIRQDLMTNRAGTTH